MVTTISARRYGIYFILAALLLLTVTRYRDGIVSTVKYHYSSYLPGSSAATQSGTFNWGKVPVNYPVTDLTPLPTAKPQKLPKVQFAFPKESKKDAAIRKERQDAVRATFLRCWSSYKEHAWMKDELAPMSGGFKSGFGGWAASLVDSLDTLWIMGLKEEFREAAEAAVDIDLGTATTETVNVFETTIRHLGGFLAAYDLSGDKKLLAKAKEFGEMLLKAFDTPNRMPITRWKPQEALKGKQTADEIVLVAEIGSLTMEFTRLAQITGDMRFYDAVDRIMKTFDAQQEATSLPGMWPIAVNAKNEDFTQDNSFTLGAMSDSLYEYFPKMIALLGNTDPIYEKMYKRSMEVAMKHNIWRPMTPDSANILMSGLVKTDIQKPPELIPEGQHLTCFAGGMFALGGRLIKDEAHVKVGQRLTDGCIWAYKNSPMGIMPEVFQMVPCDSRVGRCEWNEHAYGREISRLAGEPGTPEELAKENRLPKGFTEIRDRRYILRPEAIESVFILYRVTGETYLVDAAWDMFQAVVNATETSLANAALGDVTYSKEELKTAGKDSRMDSMESFWMAETLKYFYLIFSEPDVINLDQWVFNTEAHAFKRALPS